MLEAKRNFLVLLLLTALFSSFAGILFFLKVKSVNDQLGDFVSVVVAGQDIPARVPVTQDMLNTMEIPRKYAPEALLLSFDEIVGKYIVVPISKGEVVTSSMIKEISKSSGQSRMVNLTQSERVQFDEMLDPADHVDIIVSYQEGDKPVTRLLLEDVPVGRVSDSKEGQMAVGVELSLDDAQKLIFMQNFAKQIRVLRH